MRRYQWQLIKTLRRLSRPQLRGAEIGVYRGGTSAELLQAFPELFLYMVDNWATHLPTDLYRRSGDHCAAQSVDEQLENFNLALVSTAFAAVRRECIAESSSAAALRFADSSLDFVFIDADHTYPAVVSDLAAWWPKIRHDGILCGHDYGAPRDRRGIWGVARAVDEFARSEQRTVVRGVATIWWIHQDETSSAGAPGVSSGSISPTSLR